MKLSTGLKALAKALSITGLGITSNALLQSNTYTAGVGVIVAIAGEAIDGAATVIGAQGNGA